MRPIVLTAFSKSAPVTSFNLQSGVNSVGRSPDCEIIIHHRSVSRRHATITVEGDRVIVTDLNSRNGTFVGGQRVTQQVLSMGRSLAFGSVQCAIGNIEPDGANDDETASHGGGSDVLSAAVPESLTEAQRRVTEYLIRGDAEKQIAHALGVSAHTVHTHVRAIYRSLGVHSRAALSAKLLVEHGNEAVGDANEAGEA